MASISFKNAIELFTVLTCLFAAFTVASPVSRRSDFVVKDYHPAPRAWTNIGRAPKDHLLHLRIGLSQGRFDELERHLFEGL